MSLVNYNPISQFSGAAQYAIHSYIGALFGQPIVASIEDWMGAGKFTREVPGSKLTNDINIPIFRPGLERFDGMLSFEERSNVFVRVKRGTYKKGAKINTISGAEIDFSGWTMAPTVMATEIANNKYQLAAACLNGAWAGAPKTANGVALGFPEVANIDQIYGGPLAVLNTGGTAGSATTLPAWTTGVTYAAGDNVSSNGNVYVCTTGGVAGATAPTGTGTGISDGTDVWSYVMAASSGKPVNPADSSVVDGGGNKTWFNARQNYGITPDNILNSIKNHQIRCAMNGVELGLGREGVELWVPYLSEEDFRLLTEVMRELAGSGQLGFSPIVVNGNVTAFASQQNPVFGRARVVPVHGLRSDMWIVASPPPGNRPEFAPFLHAFGGQNGEYSINPEGFDSESNESVPHIAMFTFDKNSAMFFGVPGVSKFGDIGIAALVNEGVATQSGIVLDFNYTGRAS